MFSVSSQHVFKQGAGRLFANLSDRVTRAASTVQSVPARPISGISRLFDAAVKSLKRSPSSSASFSSMPLTQGDPLGLRPREKEAPRMLGPLRKGNPLGRYQLPVGRPAFSQIPHPQALRNTEIAPGRNFSSPVTADHARVGMSARHESPVIWPLLSQ